MELPQNSLISEMLYYPSFNKQTREYELKSNLTMVQGNYLVALPKKTGLILFNLDLKPMIPKLRDDSNIELLDGELNRLDYNFNLKFPFTNTSFISSFSKNSTSIEELEKLELIEPTTYKDFFHAQNFHKLDSEIEKIPEHHNSVHYVTRKGHERISLEDNIQLIQIKEAEALFDKLLKEIKL